MKTCMIVEDHPETGQFLEKVVSTAFPEVQSVAVSTIRAAKLCLSTHFAEGQAPDLALIDLGLPDGSGIDLIRHLKSNFPQTKAVVVTIYGEDVFLFDALGAGASGYLLKDDDLQSLSDLLSRIEAGEPPLSPAIARRLVAHFQQKIQPTSGESCLSPREGETLTLIARGLTVAEVAKDMGLSPQTVAGYVKSIYQKLHVSNRVALIKEANRRGLV